MKTTLNVMKEIYFAGGCFWGTEHYFKLVNGVIETEVGYANGHTENPTYQDVCTDKTGFAETVRIAYDPEVISLEFLTEMYFKAIDPVSVNQQGHDKGTQYRTGMSRCRTAAAQQLLSRRGLSPGLSGQEPRRLLPSAAGAVRDGQARQPQEPITALPHAVRPGQVRQNQGVVLSTMDSVQAMVLEALAVIVGMGCPLLASIFRSR